MYMGFYWSTHKARLHDNNKDNRKNKISFSILKNSRVHTTDITLKAQRNELAFITISSSDKTINSTMVLMLM